MKPRDTIYRLADGPKDRRACRALAKAMGLSRTRWGWPTIVADRGGVILGCLTTMPSKDRVVAGPLCVSAQAPRPAIVMLRLIEAYEVMLRRAGVRWYFFRVDYPNQGWQRIVEKVGHRAIHQDSAGTIYRRVIADAPSLSAVGSA